MKTHALQRPQDKSDATQNAGPQRSGAKVARTIAGSSPRYREKMDAAKDGGKHFGAQKLSYKEAFQEMAAQADAERLEWTEWDADSGGLA